MLHPTIKGTHASPDGLIGDDGVLEIKCPQAPAHLATLLGEAIPLKYSLQMQWQMRCCEKAWADFVSYNSTFPVSMRLFVKRVPRDDELIASLEKDVSGFLDELEAKLDELKARYLKEVFPN
jgi:predicted phage-related endonuclease